VNHFDLFGLVFVKSPIPIFGVVFPSASAQNAIRLSDEKVEEAGLKGDNYKQKHNGENSSAKKYFGWLAHRVVELSNL